MVNHLGVENMGLIDHLLAQSGVAQDGAQEPIFLIRLRKVTSDSPPIKFVLPEGVNGKLYLSPKENWLIMLLKH